MKKKEGKISWLNSVSRKHSNFIDNCTGGKEDQLYDESALLLTGYFTQSLQLQIE